MPLHTFQTERQADGTWVATAGAVGHNNGVRGNGATEHEAIAHAAVLAIARRAARLKGR